MHDFYFVRVVSRLRNNYVVDTYANTYFSQYNWETTTWIKELFCLLNVINVTVLSIFYTFLHITRILWIFTSTNFSQASKTPQFD